MNKKRKITLVVSIIVFLLVIIFSTSYAIYMYNATLNEENIAGSDCFKLTFTDSDDISLGDAIPLFEEEGSALTPYTFTISNVCNHMANYNVNVETLNTSSMNTNYIRYKLDDDASKILGTIEDNDSSTFVNSNVLSSKTIFSGVLNPNSEKTFNLRMWIDEASTKEQSANKVFESKIAIISTLRRNAGTRIVFNANGGTTTRSEMYVEPGSTIGSLPSAQKDGLTFVGWFTKSTGVNDSNQVFENTVVNEDIEIYAHYKDTVCKRATTLHGTYGTLQQGNTVKAGDAFDCDVNGDGVYNPDTERFYYIRKDSNNNAVLIYSNMTSTELPNYIDGCPSAGREYALLDGDSNRVTNQGPVTAYTEIPDKNTWSNVFLSNNGTRNISDVNGKYITTFNYENRAGRYLTFQELEVACGSTLSRGYGQQNLPTKCIFLKENLDTGCRTNFFLETPINSENVYRVFYKDTSGFVLNFNPRSATRPVIEVPYELLELEATQILKSEEVVVHDIMHPAIRTYFNNIESWTEGQTEESHSNYDTQMLNNIKAYNCAYTTSENNRDFYVTGSKQYCDQPNKYDTGVRDEIKVYLSNERTRVKGEEATYVTVNNGYIYNMIPNVVYYWEKVGDSSVHGFVKASGERRIISIDNTENLSSSPKIYKVRNVRDLGGLRVSYKDENNNNVTGMIKYQKLYRGEKIWGGDGNTKLLFDKLGINHELDLRESSEAASVASQEDRLQYNVTRDGLNTFEANNYVVRYDTDRENYNRTREAVTKVMQEFVDAHSRGDDSYSLYFHCRIGNDRTGTIAYILEGILGVSTEERYRDYELSYFFGFTMRNRFYEASQDGSRHTKFNYFKKAIRDAGDGVNEDALAWYMIGSTDATSDMHLVQQFRQVMIQQD